MNGDPSTSVCRRELRAFTLVELMVAVTGGLFLSIIVFAMARQGTRFYQQESRISEATLAATIGMQRLRADIGRAGYMSSPNVAADFANSKLCQNTGVYSGLLQTLRSMQVTPDTVAANNPDLQNGAIKPDQILLAGAYQNADRFIAGYLPPAPASGTSSLAIPLQPGIGALARYRYSSTALSNSDRDALLASLFPAGRVLRMVNQYGKVAYTMILGTTSTGGPESNLPTITIGAPFPPLGGSSSVCQFAGVGVEVNVVNFIQYRIANVKSQSTDLAQFGQLYTSNHNPWDANRTELVREELDPTTSAPFTTAGTGTNNQQAPVPPDIVAEYAVDLKFEVTYASPWPNPIQLLTTSSAANAGGATVYTIAGSGSGMLPQSVRSVRTRLSVRSREADRAQPIPGAGLYRLAVNGTTSYARVRTLQADIALPNHFSLTQ